MTETEKLTDDIREWVVTELAGWVDPSVIMHALLEDHGITITRQSVQYYDPTTVAGRQLSEKWKTLFHEARAAFVAGKVKIPAANKMVRVRLREEMALSAKGRGEFKVANDILNSIAEEMGDKFTNKLKHEHSGEIRGDLSDAELDARIAAAAAALGLAPPAVAGAGNADGGADAPGQPEQVERPVPG